MGKQSFSLSIASHIVSIRGDEFSVPVVLVATELQTCCSLEKGGCGLGEGVWGLDIAWKECCPQAKGLSDLKMEASASWKPLPFMCSVWLSML